MGLVAGPERPPKPAPRRGRRVRASTASATNVFTSEMASAPLSSAARANGSTAAPLGDNLTNTRPNRPPRQAFHGPPHLRRQRRIARKVDAAVLRVRAGYVELVPRQPLG